MIRLSLRKAALLFAFGASALSAQVIDSALYGWLSQYSLNTENSTIGDSACVPSASVNALVYLQNTYGSVYGTGLAGATYADWQSTARSLIGHMGTTTASGTEVSQFLAGMQSYVSEELGFSQTIFSSMAAAGNFNTDPIFDMSGAPSAEFIQNAVAANQAVVATYVYDDWVGGHAITVNGLEWDALSGTGTLYFIDPLEPSQAFGDAFEGPVKQSSGALNLTPEGYLRLTYEQYWGYYPYGPDGEHGVISAYLDAALVIGVIPEPASAAWMAGLWVLGVSLSCRRRRGPGV